MSNTKSTGWGKLVAAWAFCLVWRLVPFRPPNVEPILATMMPFAKRWGILVGLLLSVVSIMLYDVMTGTVSQWTAVTAVSYGLVGIGAGLVLPGKKNIIWYVLYAVIATLVYDLLTGVLAGAILFQMSFREGFIGQIPFTVNHLIGNIILSLALSPLVEWFVAGKEGVLDLFTLSGRPILHCGAD